MALSFVSYIYVSFGSVMDKRTRGYLFEDRGRVVRGDLSRGRIVRIPYISIMICWSAWEMHCSSLKVTVDLQGCLPKNHSYARRLCYNHRKVYITVKLIKCKIRRNKHF